MSTILKYKEINAKHLLKSFASEDFYKEQSEFQVYALEHEKSDITFKGINGQLLKMPAKSGKNYFIAEVTIELHRGNALFYQHAFQLDLAQLLVELKKICRDKEDVLATPGYIASILCERYMEFSAFQVDYNGVKDDYSGIAALLNTYRGTAPADKFGV